MILPAFAKPILQVRTLGLRPENMVLVSDGNHSLHRRFPDNPVIVVDEDMRPSEYDWWYLADLDVEIATTGDGERINALVDAVMTGSPGYLRVWKLDTGVCTRIWWLGRYWNTLETNT